MLEANKSFYASLHWLCGLLFGVGHFSVITSASLLAWSNYIPYLISGFILFVILHRKAKLEEAGKRLYALERSREHICADYLVATALVSTFSVLVFLLREGNVGIVMSEEIARPQVVLLLNLIAYLGGMYILSRRAAKERDAQERKEIPVVHGVKEPTK